MKTLVIILALFLLCVFLFDENHILNQENQKLTREYGYAKEMADAFIESQQGKEAREKISESQSFELTV